MMTTHVMIQINGMLLYLKSGEELVVQHILPVENPSICHEKNWMKGIRIMKNHVELFPK